MSLILEFLPQEFMLKLLSTKSKLNQIVICKWVHINSMKYFIYNYCEPVGRVKNVCCLMLRTSYNTLRTTNQQNQFTINYLCNNFLNAFTFIPNRHLQYNIIAIYKALSSNSHMHAHSSVG